MIFNQTLRKPVNLPSMKQVEQMINSSPSIFDFPMFQLPLYSVKEEKLEVDNNSADEPNIIRIVLSPEDFDCSEDSPIVCDESEQPSTLVSPISNLHEESCTIEDQCELTSTDKNQKYAIAERIQNSEGKTNNSEVNIELDSSSSNSKKRTIAFRSHSAACYSEWLATR